VTHLAWSQLRFRAARAIALLAGLLLATTAFTVLTAASRTAQARTTGTVSAHFVPTYDILVRPAGTRTALETHTDTVQPNFLAGIYGGITMDQYHAISGIPGVAVAAPIAMVGYALLGTWITWPLPTASLAEPGRQLYRATTTWVSGNGTSAVTQPPSYVYVTPNRLSFDLAGAGGINEVLPGGGTVAVCPFRLPQPGDNPFGPAVQSTADCWSRVNHYAPPPGVTLPDNPPSWGTSWVLPVLIAAIDPAAEAKLDGLNHAVISGSYLPQNATDGQPSHNTQTFPVLAASQSGITDYSVSQLQQLAAPTTPPRMTADWLTRETPVTGQTLAVERTTAEQAYRSLLTALQEKGQNREAVNGYWSVGPIRFRREASGPIVPVPVHNPLSVWTAGAITEASMDNADNQYRVLTAHAPTSNSFTGTIASPQLVGIFNPAKVTSHDPLSRVPLGYEPVTAAPANAASRAALRGTDLGPNQNLGGLVSQPVDLVTTLSALPALQNTGYYGQDIPITDPISVIRVRVAGVTGPDPVSLERIREVAKQIAVRTHLNVDIVTGSSPVPTSIVLPAGRFGQPALSLTENWVKKGVAIAILRAVDKKSIVLFTLILVVCVLFVANAASAAVSGRRRELGVLACLGWTRPRLFAAVLAELAGLGLTAGLLGTAAALPLSAALGLHASLGRAALAVPVAVVVALIAGAVPAWQATRAEPLSSVRPPVLAVRRARRTSGVTGLALINVLRTPGRSALGAVSLAVGTTALTILAAVTFAFRGDVVGSLLGDAVAVQVRGVDYVAAIATVALGVLSVADVVVLGIRERAAEIATIRTFGWRESALFQLAVTEGVIIGLFGSLAGAALGLAATAEFAGQLTTRLYLIAVVAVIAGTLVTAGAAMVATRALRRLPDAHLLAED
jgi:hypothetical protein